MFRMQQTFQLPQVLARFVPAFQAEFLDFAFIRLAQLVNLLTCDGVEPSDLGLYALQIVEFEKVL